MKFLADPANATGKVVIKAQVLVGGRGKAGGVRFAASADEAEDVAAQILALEIKGLPVRRVLVGPAAEIVKEYYLSVLLDRSTKRLMFIGSAEGGVEIEQIAVDNPDAIVYEHVDPLLGLPDYAARELAFKIGFGAHWKAGAAIAKGLLRTMVAYDADLVEINPLAVISEHGADGKPAERLVCLDAKIAGAGPEPARPRSRRAGLSRPAPARVLRRTRVRRSTWAGVGLVMLYLSIIVLIPLAAVFWHAAAAGSGGVLGGRDHAGHAGRPRAEPRGGPARRRRQRGRSAR